jgi:hypothetical protein
MLSACAWTRRVRATGSPHARYTPTESAVALVVTCFVLATAERGSTSKCST